MTTPSDNTTPNAASSNRYAATMATYAEAKRSLLARLDGCPCGASAPSDAVKSASRQPTTKQTERTDRQEQ